MSEQEKFNRDNSPESVLVEAIRVLKQNLQDEMQEDHQDLDLIEALKADLTEKQSELLDMRQQYGLDE